MFIAIIGTRLSGKSTVETYLVEKGFVPVRIISRTSEYGDKAQASKVVSCFRVLSLSRLAQTYPISSRQPQGITTIFFLS